MVLADAKYVEAESIGELYLLEQLLQALSHACGRGPGRDVGEGSET